MYDVIIPARNEQNTIGAIVHQFMVHPCIGQVIVVRDDDTIDDTADVALAERAIVVYGTRGKGENIQRGIYHVKTNSVILCDADYQGLTALHISQLIINQHEFVIGVPDFPLTEVLMSPKVTWDWMPRIFETYAWVSGFRKVSTRHIGTIDLHGYLTEVQINAKYRANGIEPEFVHMRGLYSPFKMDEQRMAELVRDREWGKEHGIFGG